MQRTLRVAVQVSCGALLCATVLATPAEKSSGECAVRALDLEKPAYMVVDAVVRGDRLLLPDYTSGLRRSISGPGRIENRSSQWEPKKVR